MNITVSGYINRRRISNLLWSVFRAALIFSICFIIIYPLLLKLSLSIRGVEDIYNPTVVWIPQHFTLDHYRTAFTFMNYPRAFMESLGLAFTVTLIQTFICALSGYSFARLKFRGQGIVFALVIFTIVVPPQTIIITRYMTFLNFWPLGGVRLINTYWPFIISAITGIGINTGLFIYLYRQFFRSIPKELEEAAMVDGTSVFKIFTKIILPNATPMLITVALFSFVWQWNDAYYVTLYMNNANVVSINVLSIAADIVARSGGIFIDYSAVSLAVNAGMMLTIAPLIIIYLFMQRHFVEGIERSGIVG